MKSTLLIATRTDPASVNIANHVIRKYLWDKLLRPSVAINDNAIYRTKTIHGHSVFLWYVNKSTLSMNYTDQLFLTELRHLYPNNFTSHSISNVMFLSRHAAASGTLSLTVHPIGIPWMTDASQVGGIPGKCSPPNPHIASLYRDILNMTKERNLLDKFQVTLEATHHGPYVEVPACFVEIGSNESEWSNSEAGDMWSVVLGKHLGLVDATTNSSDAISGHDTAAIDSATAALNSDDSLGNDSVACYNKNNDNINDVVINDNVFNLSTVDSSISQVTAEHSSEITNTSNSNDMEYISNEELYKGVVVVTLGGGHYVPKTNDMARYGTGLYTGHSLTTYSLKPYLDGSIEHPVEGGWRHIIWEAIESTRIALPDAQLICLLDKGAFNAEHRALIAAFLDEKNIQWTVKTSDVKKIWESLTCV